MAGSRTATRLAGGPRIRWARQPWPGYDTMTVEEIRDELSAADPDVARAARDYERRHRNRTEMLRAVRPIN